MAMAVGGLVFFIFSCLLAYLQQVPSSAISAGGGFRVAHFHLLRPEQLVCSSSPSNVAPRHRNTLPILHRHGHCYHHVGGSKPEYRHTTLARDLPRVASINARLSAGTSVGISNDNTHQSRLILPVLRGVGDYVVTVGLGTPRTDQVVEIDTGSDLCWVQCKVCNASCFPQPLPLFDPSASSSYRNICCTSPPCGDFHGRCTVSTKSCLYSYGYEDGSGTDGVLATDTLTLTPSSVFSSFVFGCGHDNRGTFWRETGLFGLGRTPYSLVSQLQAADKNVFSYCLLSKSNTTTGFLTLGGNEAAVSSSVLHMTPMLTDARDPLFYFIDLIGISVGDTQLPIPPTVFQRSGTILDSNRQRSSRGPGPS